MDDIQKYVREMLAQHPIFAVIFAALPTITPLLISIYQKHKDSEVEKDKSEDGRSVARAQLLDAQQASLNAEQARWFGLLREENNVLRQMVKDRDHWTDIARAWYNVAHEIMQLLRSSYYENTILTDWIKLNPSATVKSPPERILDDSKIPVLPLSIEDILK